MFARIDHAAGAAGMGLSLRPTELLIFGNARGGTPLMQSVQTIGIDLPLKALVWQDASGKTWLSYNDPAGLAERHGVSGEAGAAVTMMTVGTGCRGESGNHGLTDVLAFRAADYSCRFNRDRNHLIWSSNLAAPLPVFDSRSSASRPPAA